MTYEQQSLPARERSEPPAPSGTPRPGPSSPERCAPGRWTRLRRHRRPLLVLAVFALLAQMAFAMVSTAVRQTPTIDEPVYVGTAVVYVREHSLRFNPEHPPLGKLIIASGTVFAHPRLEPGFRGDQGQLGRRLLYESGNDPWQVMFWARLPVMVVTLLFGLAVFGFARDLVGSMGGLAALALYTFSPDLITNGSLATLDVPAAGFVVTAAWMVWRARYRPLSCLALAGVASGAAVATKMSTLPAVPVLLALAGWSYWHSVGGAVPRARRTVRALAAAFGVGVVLVGVVWATYLVVDPRLRWTTPSDVPTVHGLRALLIDRLPFPDPYRDGMRIQFGFESDTWRGYLFGRLYTGSLWYYLPAALLVKTPLGMLVLWLAGAAAMTAVPRLRAAAPYVLIPPALLLAAAMQGSRDLGVRYALFVPVFLAVAAACLPALRRRWAYAVTAVLVVFVALSSLRTYPYYLPYSNEAFGGPAKTHLRLHDSNVDWGQDLGRLADRLRERYPGTRDVWLVYKGSGVPSWYGIHGHNPLKVSPDRVHGLLVVSDTSIAKADGRLEQLIRGSRAIDDVGHSITIFRRP
ncbi:phospholipid carrier-dependent glycosyltransferase [Streptomyces sp. NPDC048231]|uniref:phospholipid carrier-dependent glycosyltransferase n=1 Tax=unclassified Streptomyces TaxID=2593676 RepID=UPI00367BFC62